MGMANGRIASGIPETFEAGTGPGKLIEDVSIVV